MSEPKQSLDWGSVVELPDLGAEDLDLWKIDCGSGGAPLDAQWAVLSARERARAERLRLAHHRERYVRAHAGLRRILACYIRISAHHLVFAYGPSGKPSLTGSEKHLAFNMTTSDELALVAVSRERPVGIDCERIRPRMELTSLARRMFTAEDAERIAAARDEERLHLFYRAWTSMEAGVKADGRGLFRRKDPPATDALQIAHFIPADGFIAAVASAALPPSDDWRAFALAWSNCGEPESTRLKR